MRRSTRIAQRSSQSTILNPWKAHQKDHTLLSPTECKNRGPVLRSLARIALHGVHLPPPSALSPQALFTHPQRSESGSPVPR